MMEVTVCDQEKATKQSFAQLNKHGRTSPDCYSEMYLCLLLQQLFMNQLESMASLCHDLQSSSQALQLSSAAALTCGNTEWLRIEMFSNSIPFLPTKPEFTGIIRHVE